MSEEPRTLRCDYCGEEKRRLHSVVRISGYGSTRYWDVCTGCKDEVIYKLFKIFKDGARMTSSRTINRGVSNEERDIW